MNCTTGKSSFHTENQAIEALIQNHVRHQHRAGSGPLNIYQYEDCGKWHFTSRPPMAKLLQTVDVQRRIREESRSLEWERKLR